MHDAYALSDLILDDHYAESTSTGRVQDGIPDELVRGRKEGKVVDLAGWGKIDAAERENAKRRGLAKEREKFTRVEDMLAVL
jgi:adrenodoxin-NADP+ reductase